MRPVLKNSPKVALLAFNFKPDQAIGAVRAENWAAWASEHAAVTVITRESQILFNDDLETRYSIVRPRSLLLRIIEHLNNRRHHHTERNVSINKSSRNGVFSGSGILSYRMPCLYDLWFFSCYQALKKQRPDIIIATHSPYVSFLVSWAYSILNPGTKIWVDFRDLWSANYHAHGVWIFRSIERLIEKHLLRKSAVVSTVSNGLKEKLMGIEPTCKPQVIFNAPSNSLSLDNCSAKPLSTALRICYTGTLTLPSRDPAPLFEWLRDLRETHQFTSDNIRFSIASRDPRVALQSASDFGVEEFIENHGRLTREGAFSLQSGSDVLLILESGESCHQGNLTGKVFEYLLSDKPILLIGPGKESEIYKLISKHERLISMDDLKGLLIQGRRPQSYTSVNYSEVSKNKFLSTFNALLSSH